MINDPVPFLANIALVARADGKVSASELGRIESIRTDMKFKKGDLAAAVRLVDQGQHRLTPVGSFADQVKNLECILFVAYADEDLGEAERGLISDFCKLIGIHPDQLERLSREALTTLEAKGKMCPSCAADAAPDAKFCPKCGANLEAPQESIQVEFEIPTQGITIEFADSTGISFPKSVSKKGVHGATA